jgi:ubiquitin-like modifier-activating enzyme ATG7
LDQQCTVTRPGLSYMASALAVELLVSLLQYSDPKDAPINSCSRLGRLPHQIRGNLANQETFTLSGTAFEHCTCCSESILKEFEQKGYEFIKMACNSSNELERISGLTEMKKLSESIENLSMSDENENERVEADGDGNDF